jgi:hypothetical protein
MRGAPVRWRSLRKASAGDDAESACARAEARVMTLLCGLCGDTTELEKNLVVLEAQVIVFVDAHSAHDGHAVHVRVESGGP